MGDKKFSTVEIVLLVIVALLNDVALIFTDLIFGVPVVGQAIGGLMEGVNVLIWGGMTLLFWMKTRSFGKGGLLQAAGGIAEFFGMPGRTATVVIGIIITNNELIGKLAVAGAAVAATAATGGAAAPAAAGALAAEGGTLATGAVAAEGAALGGSAATTESFGTGAARAGFGTGRAGAGASEATGGAATRTSEEALGVRKEPWEEVGDIMSDLPSPERREEEAEEEPPPFMLHRMDNPEEPEGLRRAA